jgi:FlaA1/EpsC-like NDP-sugar epimerase
LVEKHIIGSRPGEKQSEVLVSKNEAPFCYELSKKYYVIVPQFHQDIFLEKYGALNRMNLEYFDSNNAEQLSLPALKELLTNEKWLWK